MGIKVWLPSVIAVMAIFAVTVMNWGIFRPPEVGHPGKADQNLRAVSCAYWQGDIRPGHDDDVDRSKFSPSDISFLIYSSAGGKRIPMTTMQQCREVTASVAIRGF